MNQPVLGVPQMLPTQVIDTSTDSREILKHARAAARRRKLQDWFVWTSTPSPVERVVERVVHTSRIGDPRPGNLSTRLSGPALRHHGDTGCAIRASAAAPASGRPAGKRDGASIAT